MLYRPLGRTDLLVSEIGFGAASWWGMAAYSEAEAVRMVHVAVERGVTLFDTAPGYSRGEAEPRLGRALQGRARDGLVVSTKAGTRFERGRMVRDMSLAGINLGVERSLSRLGVGVISLLQLHGPDLEELTDDFIGGLLALKSRGLVRALGVNSFDPAVVERAIALAGIDVVMIDYNVLRSDREPLIARAAEAGKGILAGMPLAMGHTGLQTLKLRAPRDVWYALRALKNHRREMAQGLRMTFLGETSGMTGAQAALAYVLENPHVASAVVGSTRLKHLQENLDVPGLRLPPEVLLRIRRVQAGE